MDSSEIKSLNSIISRNLDECYPLEKVAYSLDKIVKRLKQKLGLCNFEFSFVTREAIQKLRGIRDYLYGDMDFIISCISMVELREDRIVYKKMFDRSAQRLKKEIQKLEEIAGYTFMEEERHSLENIAYYLETIAKKLEAAIEDDIATAKELSADHRGLFKSNPRDRVNLAVR